MKPIDVIRYFGLALLFGALEIIGAALWDLQRSSYDKICVGSALITILWAIRDGQNARES